MTNQHDPKAVALADAVLKAAGSGFQHYMPSYKERIIEAATKEMRLQYYNGMFDAAESLAKQFEHEGFEARAADIRRKAYEWAGEFKPAIPLEQHDKAEG